MKVFMSKDVVLLISEYLSGSFSSVLNKELPSGCFRTAMEHIVWTVSQTVSGRISVDGASVSTSLVCSPYVDCQ